MKTPRTHLRHAALAIGVLLASSTAFAQSAAVDFTTLLDAPTNPTVTLGNGVDVSVSGTQGHWEHISAGGYDYDHYTLREGGTQTWTFSEPVDISFSVLGLNCPNEGIQFSGTATPVTGDSINAVHTWDDGTQTVSNPSPRGHIDGPEISIFSASNTTSLTLTGVGGGTGCRRGLGSMTVTPAPVAPPAVVAPVPVDNPLALVTTGLLLSGLAGVAFKRRRSPRH